MTIISFREINTFMNIISDIRKSGYCVLKDSIITGRNNHYPNCLIYSTNNIYSPYDERVMSLKKESFYDNNQFEYIQKDIKKYQIEPVFFFIYNVDNYYHFLYDSIPILYFYKLLQKEYPSIKLLINTSHPSKSSLPPFVREAFDLLDIKNIVFPSDDTLYTTLFIGTSLTHGRFSNEAPSKLCYSVWNDMIKLQDSQLPKRIYISRRSNLSKHPENIGTNYTMRRRCENENKVVEVLEKYNIREVFCEDLTMAEKINMFANVELIVGFIGGGMANCIFSKPNTKVLCLVTPTFLDVNTRFAYSMDHTEVTYLYNCEHVPSRGKYTLYTRVRIIDQESNYFGQIGEIEGVSNNIYKIKISRNDVAGFSKDFKMEEIDINEEFLEPLDQGLNSPFICDISQIETYLKNI